MICGQMENSTKWDREEGEHPLQTAWAFWYDKKQSRKTTTSEFRQRLHKIGSFDSVESFWKLYLHLKRPSALETNVNLYLFRDGPTIAPMWEAFPRGGCWILKVKKKLHGTSSVLGNIWHDMVLATIGEAFEQPDVVGISVCIRKSEDLISVWNSDNRNEETRFLIGERLKEILELEPSTVIEYKRHAESMTDCSTFRNAKPYVFAVDSAAAADKHDKQGEKQGEKAEKHGEKSFLDAASSAVSAAGNAEAEKKV